MARSDLLEYRGLVGPEELKEPVVFQSSVPVIVIAGAVQGFVAWAAMFFGAMVVATVFQTWDEWRSMMTAITALAVLFGILKFVRYLSRHGGLTMTVSEWGVTVRRAGASIQSCSWDEMTALVSGTGWRRSQRLADQYGQPFPTFGLESSHLDRRLAWRVIAMWAKRLADSPSRVAAKQAKQPTLSNADMGSACPSRTSMEKVRAIAPWLCVPAAGLTAASIMAMMWTQNRLVAASGDPASSFAARAGWLFWVIVGGIGSAVGITGFLVSLAPIFERIPVRESRKFLILRAFVIERKGRFEPIQLVNGIWFRYPDPEGLRATDSTRETAFALIPFCLACGLVPIWVLGGLTPVSDLASAFGLLSFSGIVWMLVNRSRLHRALTCRVRRRDDGYEIDDGVGRRITCQVVSEPGQRSAAHQFGAMALVLRGDNGRIYRIDPRFLEEAPQD